MKPNMGKKATTTLFKQQTKAVAKKDEENSGYIYKTFDDQSFPNKAKNQLDRTPLKLQDANYVNNQPLSEEAHSKQTSKLLDVSNYNSRRPPKPNPDLKENSPFEEPSEI
jgi:hypothetical protein